VTEFYGDRSRSDGFCRLCKECTRAKNKAWYASNADLAKERSRDWGAKNREYRSAYDRTRYPREKEVRAARAAVWRAANPERARELARLSAARNREHTRRLKRANEARRRAAKASVLALPFGVDQLAARTAMFGDRCWICRGPYEALDHVKPLCKGGPHMLANLRPICATCNARKGGRWPYSAEPAGADSTSREADRPASLVWCFGRRIATDGG